MERVRMDKAPAAGVEWEIVQVKAAQDAERGAAWVAVVDAVGGVSDAGWDTPTRVIPGSNLNSATCKPPLKNSPNS